MGGISNRHRSAVEVETVGEGLAGGEGGGRIQIEEKRESSCICRRYCWKSESCDGGGGGRGGRDGVGDCGERIAGDCCQLCAYGRDCVGRSTRCNRGGSGEHRGLDGRVVIGGVGECCREGGCQTRNTCCKQECPAARRVGRVRVQCNNVRGIIGDGGVTNSENREGAAECNGSDRGWYRDESESANNGNLREIACGKSGARDEWVRGREGGLESPFPCEIALDLLALDRGQRGVIGDEFRDGSREGRVPDSYAGGLGVAGHVDNVGRCRSQYAAVLEGREPSGGVEDGVKGECVECAGVSCCAGCAGVDGMAYKLARVRLSNSALREAGGTENSGGGGG